MSPGDGCLPLVARGSAAFRDPELDSSLLGLFTGELRGVMRGSVTPVPGVTFWATLGVVTPAELLAVLLTELLAACIVAAATTASAPTAPPDATPEPAAFTVVTPDDVALGDSATSLRASPFVTPTNAPAPSDFPAPTDVPTPPREVAWGGVVAKFCAVDLIEATFWGALTILDAPDVA